MKSSHDSIKFQFKKKPYEEQPPSLSHIQEVHAFN